MLALCAACKRHVKSTPCPFCGDARTTGVRLASGKRGTRAQVVAGAALVGIASFACGDQSSAQFYGGPPGDWERPSPTPDSGGIPPNEPEPLEDAGADAEIADAEATDAEPIDAADHDGQAPDAEASDASPEPIE